jgi:hypothetical protein
MFCHLPADENAQQRRAQSRLTDLVGAQVGKDVLLVLSVPCKHQVTVVITTNDSLVLASNRMQLCKGSQCQPHFSAAVMRQ